MVRPDNRLTRWWQGSILYSLLAGSFFFRWLVGADEDNVNVYDFSRTAALSERIISPILNVLYRAGDVLRRWLAGSFLVRRWLALTGIIIILFAVVALRATLSWALAGSMVLIGLGLILTPDWQALAEGSWLGRLTSWWLND